MAGAPLLQVLTRCFRRPSMLVRNLASVAALGAGVEHTLLVDTAGRGVGASYEALAGVPVRGQYIWILDDDDVCIFPELLTELRKLAARRVDVVVVRMDHGELGVLPDDAHWRAAPELGAIGCSACIVRREVWMEARAVFVPGVYTSDFALAKFILDAKAQRGKEERQELQRLIAEGTKVAKGAEKSDGQGYAVEWLDVVASRVQRRSLGAAEI